ncbi:probable G-protein coupled receptor 148 [Chanos chanos]|uniref:Probable G-protein coupled receptor 148 n=1 Tax=Chanos chanos TaxID=29144 RepID=A0A6J2VBM4_CHACN|nr:probable G-protein coupled receptor 148 [Chanos chanos]
MDGKTKPSAKEYFYSLDDLSLSLLCTFGSWYNSSGRGKRPSPLSENTNTTSHTPVELFALEWQVFLPPQQMRGIYVCPLLGFLAVSLVTPVILTRILTSTELRRQTRYLLLANALLSDLLFLSVYMLSTCLNAAGVIMSEWACATLLFLMGVLYSGGILTAKAMVLDTLLAVLVPLRYLSLWPVYRTRFAIGAIWIVGMFIPAASVGSFLWYHSSGPCALQICSLPLLLALAVSHSKPLQVSMLLTVTAVLLILLLVFSGYLVLCCRTRNSGVWRGERSSRARGTFLIHYLNLFLSVCPMLVLVIELLLYSNNSLLDLRVTLWVSLIVCNVLLVLPKALAPYLYGLRYRDLCGALQKTFRIRRPPTVATVM